MAEAAPEESHVVGACSGLESTLGFLKALKSLNSFRDFQVPLGNKGCLNKFDDITSWIKSRNSDMKKTRKCGIEGARESSYWASYGPQWWLILTMQWPYRALAGKRKDFAKFENIHIEKANNFVSLERRKELL